MDDDPDYFPNTDYERGYADGRAALPSEDDLAKAVLAARSHTTAWKGLARATQPTKWDRLMAKRILATLSAKND